MMKFKVLYFHVISTHEHKIIGYYTDAGHFRSSFQGVENSHRHHLCMRSCPLSAALVDDDHSLHRWY